MKINYIAIILFILGILFSIGCEKEIDLNVKAPKSSIVVEGHIENGIPPYVLLTKNAAFYGNISLNNLAAYFVHNATITVSTDNDTVQLVEYTAAVVQTLPDSVAVNLAKQLGISIRSAAEFPPVSIYSVGPTDLGFVGQIGKKYDLKITTDSTTIIDELFQVSLETHLKDLSGQLTYQTASNYNQNPGLFYRATYNDNKLVVKSRMLLVGDRFYALQVYTFSEKSLNDGMNKFLESFRIIEKQ